MGAWGPDILEDDFACDVHGDFMDAYDSGEDFHAIRTKLENANAKAISDSDDGPVFWLALAYSQWECGVLDQDIRAKVDEIIQRGYGLALWSEGTAPVLEGRRAALKKFSELLKNENSAPRKRQVRQAYPPVFAPGDCLAIKLPKGGFGAALVLATNHTQREYGKDLIGLLAYRNKTVPPLQVFESRKWLMSKKPSNWFGKKQAIWVFSRTFAECAASVEKIGSIKLRWTDSKTSKTSCPRWLSIMVHIEKGLPTLE